MFRSLTGVLIRRHSALRSRIADVRSGLGDLLRQPGVLPIAISSLIARLPKSLVPVSTVLLIHERTGEFALPGIVAALIALSDAASVPFQARLIDRYGRAVVLLPCALLHTVAMATLIILAGRPGTTVAVLICAVFAGVGMPPVSGAVKAVWAQLVGSERISAAYTLESLLQQIIFAGGPLLVLVIVATVDASVALAASTLMTVVGTCWVVAATRRVDSAPEPATGSSSSDGASSGGSGETLMERASGSWTSSALSVPVVRILAFGVLLQGIAFGVRPVALAGLGAAIGVPALAGLLQSTVAVGGLVGSFVMRGVRPAREYAGLLARSAVALLPPALFAVVPSTPTVVMIALLLLAPGLYLTPVAATSYAIIATGTSMDQRTEAFGWLSTALALGSSIGSAIAGWTTDLAGPMVALLVAPAAMAVAALASRGIGTGPVPHSRSGQ